MNRKMNTQENITINSKNGSLKDSQHKIKTKKKTYSIIGYIYFYSFINSPAILLMLIIISDLYLGFNEISKDTNYKSYQFNLSINTYLLVSAFALLINILLQITMLISYNKGFHKTDNLLSTP
jgi:hypothetical protein